MPKEIPWIIRVLRKKPNIIGFYVAETPEEKEKRLDDMEKGKGTVAIEERK
jgi:hypothetical protein